MLAALGSSRQLAAARGGIRKTPTLLLKKMPQRLILRGCLALPKGALFLATMLIMVAFSAGIDSLAFRKSVKGPLEDAQCDVEAVEAANTQQLSVLMADVLNLSFFRKFRVLDDECPF